MKNLITEARELHAGWMAHESIHHGGGQGAKSDDGEMSRKFMFWLVDDFPELCDALEKAEEQIERVHKALDFAETQRQRSRNYTELAINNGLALGRIAVILQHDFEPLPAPPEEGAEHERD